MLHHAECCMQDLLWASFPFYIYLYIFFSTLCLSSLVSVHRVDLALLMVCFLCTNHSHTVNLNRIILMHVIRFFTFPLSSVFYKFSHICFAFCIWSLSILHYLKQQFQSQDTIKNLNDETNKIVMKNFCYRVFFLIIQLFGANSHSELCLAYPHCK